MCGIFISYRREDSEATRAGAAVTLVKNPRLTGLEGSIDVGIDKNSEGFITSESDGSSTLDFRVTTGEHRSKFTNKDTNTEHSGTFS